MKIGRSSKCSLQFVTKSKKEQIDLILNEYQKVCQHYIDLFWGWDVVPENKDLLKPIIDTCDSWFSTRMKKVAAREARGMVQSAKSNEGGKPHHSGKAATLGETIVEIQQTPIGTFNLWLKLTSIGNKMKLFLPVNVHKHFNGLLAIDTLRKTIILRRDSVQFFFKIETGRKLAPDACIGVDTGINTLATLSTGEKLGTDLSHLIALSKRKKWGSKGHKRVQRRIRQRIDEVARDVASKGSLVVIEDLLGITNKTKTKRRLGKGLRRSIGIWNVRYWQTRLEQRCERNRVSFRRVSPYRTSTTCLICNHADRRNRKSQEVFECCKCGHIADADVQASINILFRFLFGLYGAGCKPINELLFTV